MEKDYYYTHMKEKHYVLHNGNRRQVCAECFIEEHKQTEVARNDCKNLFFIFVPQTYPTTEFNEEQQDNLFKQYLKHGLDKTIMYNNVLIKTIDQCCCYSESHR